MATAANQDATYVERAGSGSWTGRIIAFLVVVGLLAAGVYGSTQILSRMKEEKKPSALVYTVTRGEMLITVTEDGNLESASNVDIKCQVAGGSSILSIIGDGQEVQKGDKLIELDTSVLDDQINQQKITVEKARAAMIQAEKDHSVAQISVKEFLEGTYLKDLQDKDAQITISMENLRSAENALEHSQRMFRKGYISSLELESQQFGVQRAKIELNSAKTAKDVLEKFTKLKTIEDLESKVTTAKAKLESEKAAFALEESKLKRLEAQRELCTIVAPQSGMVVYANESSGRFGPGGGGSQSTTIEEGASVRERQTILRLPDLSQMQVKVNVHETKVDSLARGMRARIRIQGRELQGTVKSIANQPEPSSFMSANVKEYATIVRIDGQPEGLKPGMTAEVEILIAYMKDTISLPVAAIVEQRGNYFCWVRKGEGNEKRPLVLGMSNDQYVEIKDGVKEGEQILLNPRAVEEEARQTSVDIEKVDVTKKFGDRNPEDGKAPAGKDALPNGPGPGDAKAAPNAAGPGVPGADGPRRGGPDSAGGPGGEGSKGKGSGKSGFDMTASDKDGDGKLSKDEAPSFLQDMFDTIDTNKDGVLDKAELSAMRGKRGGGAGGGGRGNFNLMSNDKDGDGKVSRDEAAALPPQIFERMDANTDGFIDQAEIDTARQRFPGGGGQGGPGGGPGPGGPPGGGGP
jgi:HlyD family secretion protein